jgi:SAM-dependent methyltransferase
LASHTKESKRNIYSWKDYWRFFYLGRRRILSEQDYFNFEKFQGSLLVRYLLNQGVDILQSQALDLGCGFGGYTVALQEAGARVTGLDLNTERMAFLNAKVAGDACRTPFLGTSFSLVICSSLIEHILQPLHLLDEIYRILQLGGYLYLSFPPFFSPVGGHQFAPYHLLGEKFALRIYRLRRKRSLKGWVERYISSSPESYTSSFGSWGLYRRTIAWAVRELQKYSWDILDCSTRYSPLNLARIPFAGEFLTWHVQFLVQKR